MKVFILLIVFTGSCSSLHQASGNKSTSAPVHKELRLDVPKDTWEPIFFKSIDERARIANLKTLRAASLPDDDLEVRVWHGFGLTALEGFVLKRAAGEWSAIHLDGIHSNLPRSEYEKKLQTPKAGWEFCWRRLEEAGILTLPDASAIACSAMVNDGMSYVVEFNSKGTYRTYLYDNPDYAKCDEAKRMIAIGNIIAEEFDVPEMSTKP
jgi:hypothetical protein